MLSTGLQWNEWRSILSSYRAHYCRHCDDNVYFGQFPVSATKIASCPVRIRRTDILHPALYVLLYRFIRQFLERSSEKWHGFYVFRIYYGKSDHVRRRYPPLTVI